MSFFYVFIRNKNIKVRVIGCLKIIDGDFKCKEVLISFGFDIVCKVNLSGNVDFYCFLYYNFFFVFKEYGMWFIYVYVCRYMSK